MSDISAEIVGQSQPVADTQSTPSLSFSDLHAKAMAFEPSTPATPETPAAPSTEPAEQLAVTDAAVEQPAAVDANTSAAQLAQLKPTDLVEVEVGGELKTMPWSEARASIMRQQDYTRKAQQLAREREQFGAERTEMSTAVQERDAVVQLLRDEGLMRQFLAKQFPSLLAQEQAIADASVGVDPNDIATVGQIEQARAELNRQVAQVQQTLQQQAQSLTERVTQTIEERQLAARLGGDVNATIKTLFTENPLVEKLIPNAEQLLRYEVMQMRPQNEAETLEAFKTVMGGWAENIKDAVAQSNKSAVVEKQKLSTNNIQPPGGSTVIPQKLETPMKNGKLDWDALRSRALDRLG